MARCIFQPAWIEQCQNQAAPDSPVCEQHKKYRCWCGAQAVKECSAASIFVCGAPTCAAHECRNTAAGLTGSIGWKHSERGHAQWLAWKEARPGEEERDGRP